MKFENTQVWGFKHAVRGMRNALESWDKSDSYENFTVEYKDDVEIHHPYFRVGAGDLALMKKLIRAGNSHRKFLRQIFVSVDITAPMYLFNELDTYKVGTVANSTSKMHTLSKSPITMDNFEMDDFHSIGMGSEKTWELIIGACEDLRKKYLETKDKRYWKELIRLLPESWLQKRTITMNYENLLAMCSKDQRRFHKLNEWSGIDDPTKSNFISWTRTLPYAQELIFIDEL